MFYQRIYPIQWYAQTPSRLFSASQLKNFKTGEVERATDDEFKSSDYVCSKNLNREGIYRFGVTNGLESKNQFVDFYIMDEDSEDYHYKTKDIDYNYGISICFTWLEFNAKSKDNVQEYSKKFNHFSKYLTLTRAQQKESEVRLNDIFVHKYGHMDISLGEQKEMSHDGYSIGFQAVLKIDDTKFVNMSIRGNIGLLDTRPIFRITLTPNFDCQCADIELMTNDIEFKKKKLHCMLQKYATTSIHITRNDDTAEKEIKLKSEYRSIARFIDWKSVPKVFQIDWDNDDVDTIRNTFLAWAEYLKDHNDEKILDTKYFTVVRKPGYPIYYHNDYITGKVGFLIQFDNEMNLVLPITTFPPNSYLYTKSEDLIIEGEYDNIKYSLCITSNNKKTVPKLKLEIEPLCGPIKGKFKIDSSFVYKDAGWHEFDLAGEILIFETKD